MENITKYLNPKNILTNLAGAGILSFGLYNIHSISEVTEGGVLGLALLLEHHFGISPSITNFIITALCYFFGFRTFGRIFLLNSFVSVAGFSFFYSLFERFPRIYPDISNFPLIASVLGGIMVGVGVGLCVKSGGAPTGDDALAMSICQKIDIPIQAVYLISDLIVLVFSITYIPIDRIIYSLITVFISGQIVGKITQKKSNI